MNILQALYSFRIGLLISYRLFAKILQQRLRILNKLL